MSTLTTFALVFVCPQTGHPIETGIEMEMETLSKVQGLNVRVRCAHCGGEHQQPINEPNLVDAA